MTSACGCSKMSGRPSLTRDGGYGWSPIAKPLTSTTPIGALLGHDQLRGLAGSISALGGAVHQPATFTQILCVEAEDRIVHVAQLTFQRLDSDDRSARTSRRSIS